VEVSGPRTLVNKIEEMLTEPIDLSGRNAGFDGSARLVNRSPLITVSSGGTVEYRVRVTYTIITRTFPDVPVSFEGLDSRFEIAENIEPGSLTIRGRQIDLADKDVPEGALRVDARDIARSGVYSLPVTPALPDGFEVLEYSPQEIQISVTRKKE
jgi:hypothetical protein